MNKPSNNKNEPNQSPPKDFLPKNIYWIYLIFGVILFSQVFALQQFSAKEITWNKFEQEILATDDVRLLEVVNKEELRIYIKEDRLEQEKFADANKNQFNAQYYLEIGSVEVFEQKLEKAKETHNISQLPDVKYKTETNWFKDILGWMLPFILLIALWFFIMNRVGGNRGGMGDLNPYDFGKSKATVFDKNNRSQTTFADVAGLEEAKVEVMEIVKFLKNPTYFTRLGAKIPKGVILVGPPGTGKTLMAKAVAGEAQVPFFHMSGSEFVEMFVGVGASRVRDLFKKAKEKSPSIIFIDEIDAIGRARGAALSMRSNDERESTLNQLLAEMDGFGTNTGVIVLAATNRADVLDKALLRPGRFDRHIYLELPSMLARKAIFKVHLKPLTLAEDIDVDALAGQTPGFSGADIANICNEAALIAARGGKVAVEMEDFFSATDRIIAGLEKKSKIISPQEKQIVAYHEAGHATTSWFLEHADSLLKVSIVPRGKSLGSAWYLPEEHQIYTKAQFEDRLCAALGGRAAEEVVFGEISSGALDDLEKVTKQAYTMVAYYGLDDKLGNISYYDSTGQYEQSIHRPYSEATAKLIDEEVRKTVTAAYDRTKKLLLKHRSELNELAELLLEKEVVVKEDLEGIFGKRIKADRSTRKVA